MKKDLFRARLASEPAEPLVKYILAPGLEEAVDRSFNHLSQINMAHVIMLSEQKIIKTEEASKILKALWELEQGGIGLVELKRSTDLYANIEGYIVTKIGVEIGGKMHTGRSRNDLYKTVTRMDLRDEINGIVTKLLKLQEAEIKLAEENLETVMPGYTHLQHAQPITLAHYLVGHCSALVRDAKRFENAYLLTNLSPLGAAALAATGFPIDRKRTAELLGFSGLVKNSLDAVATVDYAVETVFVLSITMADLSRIVEDLILWNSLEFRMIELDDAYAGTSSIMPQKKNPSSLEYCRAKTGHVYGHLMAALSAVKGIPFMHCRDIGGEVPRALWSAFEETKAATEIVNGVLSTLKVNRNIMEQRTHVDFSTVTDLADTLVEKKDLSFRSAHGIISRVVAQAIQEGKVATAITSQAIDDVARDMIGKALNMDEKEIRSALDPLKSVEKRKVPGGPAPKEVRRQIRDLRREMEDLAGRLEERINNERRAERMLKEVMHKYL
jgi:argininosuccinate lyase